MDTSYRPRVSTLEFVSLPSHPLERVGLAVAESLCMSWVTLGSARGASCIRRHLQRLRKAHRTDIIGVVALHCRPAMRLLYDENMAAFADPDDSDKALPDGCPLAVHECARAAALCALVKTGVAAAPDSIKPFLGRNYFHTSEHALPGESWIPFLSEREIHPTPATPDEVGLANSV